MEKTTKIKKIGNSAGIIISKEEMEIHNLDIGNIVNVNVKKVKGGNRQDGTRTNKSDKRSSTSTIE